jgi:catechol 2,3-dioxygenase-like lactoylglutathione lyase family enzyme
MQSHFAIGVLFCGIALSQQSSAQNVQIPPITGLGPDHATLSVENIEKEAQWYEQVLGFKKLSGEDTDPDHLNWHLVIPGGYRIDLVKYKGSKRPAPVDPDFLQQGWVHVDFHVDDVAAALKTLQAFHIDVQVKTVDGKPVQLRFHDPEGNELEVRRNVVL